jgi:trehalose 6-phosphate phosphatase
MLEHNLNIWINKKGIKALIFDLDGVVTQTARVHAQAWKQLFNEYLQKISVKNGQEYLPFNIETDYLKYIDGIPRYDGVRNFLVSREIILPEGKLQDKPGAETVSGLGNLKNHYFQKLIKEKGVDVYSDTIAWIKEQQRHGMRTAVISASRNCKAILDAANLSDLFEIRVDGEVAAKLSLKGKPAPDIFLEAARQMGVPPNRTAIFEDAFSGVEAGKAGGFALVVGVDRSNVSAELLSRGADIVVKEFTIK